MKKLISLVCLFCLSAFLPLSVMGEPIDREAVVKRHRVCTTGTLLKSPAQVGNGKFAFGMDITGLQTFVPFNTLSDWSWHSFPLPEGMKAEDYRPVVVETHGKKIAYELRNPDQPELSEWLTKNPHRYNLGRIGFRLLREDGTEAQEIDLGNARQEIDLWTGVVYSRFELNRKEVKVRTVCHPDKDMIGVSIESELLNDGNMSIYLDFPYPDGRYFKHYIGRYDTISGHTSTFEKLAPNSVRIARTMDDTHYYATLDWTGPATFSRESEKAHKFLLQPQHTSTFSFTCCFSPEPVINVTESVASIERKSAASWEKYWRSGAAVDLSGSKDPRWLELERRIVLSQYLMRANESGLFPPQESGLVNNGWFGRFHFEMIWWHGVHYGLWNRMECFDNYLNVYKDFMPNGPSNAPRAKAAVVHVGRSAPETSTANGLAAPCLSDLARTPSDLLRRDAIPSETCSRNIGEMGRYRAEHSRLYGGLSFLRQKDETICPGSPCCCRFREYGPVANYQSDFRVRLFPLRLAHGVGMGGPSGPVGKKNEEMEGSTFEDGSPSRCRRCLYHLRGHSRYVDKIYLRASGPDRCLRHVAW